MEKGVRKNSRCSWVAPLPLKPPRLRLPNNRQQAPEQWHYIPTDKNPADYGTRSIPAIQMSATAWLNSPSFLSNSLFNRFEPNFYCLIDPENDVEICPVVATFTTHSSPVLLSAHHYRKFSTWTALTQAIARLIHISQSFQKETRSNDCKGWHYCRATFPIETLVQSNNVVLRSAHRDTKHHIASLLIRHHHKQVHNQGRHFTEGAVRAAGFWIVGGKRNVSKTIYYCVICRKPCGPMQIQKMADLPEDRLSMEPPFTNVGLDILGPWPITSCRTRGGLGKQWATIFTCMTTRAVYIEVLKSLDTSSLINALRRFFSIRGSAKLIHSDQGSNFVRARNELKINSTLDASAVSKHLSDYGCTWLFNPPHAPHMGRAWERLIGIAKRIFNYMLLQHGSTKLTHEVFTTFLAKVAAIVNNRPLVPVSTDLEDPVLLTPSTLLAQKIGSVPAPTGNFTRKDVSR
ncbi:unnamed protein product [Acanthosepion pharaonis]|uniref:Integrase catalytic domain-containing protein n=1 Tax=Acanthosepion pharaonis TaxID=158019 RepID=A0A812CIX1_ACAPH|nr:unnamed protein product [Sepia pharaonis]